MDFPQSLGRRTTKYPKKDQPDLTAKTTVRKLCIAPLSATKLTSVKLNQVQDLTELVALSEGVPANQLRYFNTNTTRKNQHAINYFAHMYVSCRLVYKGKQLESGTEQTLEEAGLFAAALKSSNKTVGVSVILALR